MDELAYRVLCYTIDPPSSDILDDDIQRTEIVARRGDGVYQFLIAVYYPCYSLATVEGDDDFAELLH